MDDAVAKQPVPILLHAQRDAGHGGFAREAFGHCRQQQGQHDYPEHYGAGDQLCLDDCRRHDAAIDVAGLRRRLSGRSVCLSRHGAGRHRADHAVRLWLAVKLRAGLHGEHVESACRRGLRDLAPERVVQSEHCSAQHGVWHCESLRRHGCVFVQHGLDDAIV